MFPQDLINIAPKRANWDLKRETEKKLAKLERKTQEAIHTLIRMYSAVGSCHAAKSTLGQRLAAQNGNDADLAGALNAQQEADQRDDASDEE
jgi:coiled-coil domain-containing protein 12